MWEKVISQEELRKKGRVLFKKKPKHIVIFARKDGIFAIDNRCPHQGYPLIEGTLEVKVGKTILMCHRHNWKLAQAFGYRENGGVAVS